MDAFLVYGHLSRAGHVVRRHPCIWTHNAGRLVDIHGAWRRTWPDSARAWQARDADGLREGGDACEGPDLEHRSETDRTKVLGM
jgi:hypothetical protein